MKKHNIKLLETLLIVIGSALTLGIFMPDQKVELWVLGVVMALLSVANLMRAKEIDTLKKSLSSLEAKNVALETRGEVDEIKK